MPVPAASLWTRFLQAAGRSGLPGRHRLLSALAPPPKNQTDAPFEIALHGTRYRGNLVEFIDWSIFYFGSYAPGELSLLENSCRYLRRRQDVVNFFDIGANVGEFATFMAAWATTVNAFEPNPALSDRLRDHVERNALSTVSVHGVALGDGDEEAELGSGFPGNPGSRSLTWTLPGAAVDPVTVRRGDTYFADRGLPKLDLVKIDVEGYESRVIRGLSGRMRSDRPVILMEMIGDETKGGFESEADLRRALYPDHLLKSVFFRGSRYGLSPFDWRCDTVIVLPAEYGDLS